MRNRLVLIALVAVVGCKQEGTAAEPAGTTPNSAASAGLAAAALAQAVASAAAAHAAASAAPATSAVALPSASASASAAVADSFPPQLANELGRLGFSTGPNDLLALGRDRAALINGLARLAGHSTALSAILNNDKVASAFMKRADVQASCKDPEQLKQKLLYALSTPTARALVTDPASLKALSSSKLGTQLQACSAFQTLAKNPRTLADLTRDNPAASAVVANTNFRAELDRLKIRQDAQPSKVFARRR